MFSIAMIGVSSGKLYFSRLAMQFGGPVNPALDLTIIHELIPQINVLGALVVVAYGFNAINKERTEGSLKVMLSYPIYRDKIILGKLIAGLLVISLVTVVSLTVALEIYLYTTNLVFTLDQYLRFAAFVLLSILLLSGYLGLSMLFSITFSDQKISLLAMFLLIGVFNSQSFSSYGRILSNIIFGSEPNPDVPYFPLNPQAFIFRNFISNLSPSYSYEMTASFLQHHSIRVFVGDAYVFIPSNVWSIIKNQLNSIVVLVIIPILTFAASYVLFTRRDIT
jgi:ABC-2 type transport system permease protein